MVDPASAGGAQAVMPVPPLFWLGIEAGVDRALQIVTANPPRVVDVAAAGPDGYVAVRLHIVADPDGRLFVRET